MLHPFGALKRYTLAVCFLQPLSVLQSPSADFPGCCLCLEDTLGSFHIESWVLNSEVRTRAAPRALAHTDTWWRLRRKGILVGVTQLDMISISRAF
jgi:hypothetical protein